MWKLTVERKYSCEFEGKEYENTSEVFFEADDLYEIEGIIKKFMNYGVGNYKYIIELIEKEGE